MSFSNLVSDQMTGRKPDDLLNQFYTNGHPEASHRRRLCHPGYVKASISEVGTLTTVHDKITLDI